MKFSAKRTLLLDFIILAVLFVSATAICSSYVKRPDVTPQFYQYEFGPGVMLACGKGYVNPAISIPTLDEFLSLQADSFSCKALPENLPVRGIDQFQEAEQYLIKAAGLVWSVTGISWSGLIPMMGFFYAVTVVCAYGFFRLGMNPLISASGALLFAVSGIHLVNSPHLRDYSKAPLIMIGVLIIAYLLKQSRKAWVVLTLAGMVGLIVGIGIGFRSDILIYIPFFIISILFFFPGRFGENLFLKLKALFFFGACFMISGWPVLASMAGGSNLFHVALLGFMEPFDNSLGVLGSFYQFGYLYNDGYLLSLLNAYSSGVNSDSLTLNLGTPEYDQVGKKYFLEIIRNFPADILARIYAAILNVLEMPFYAPAADGPPALLAIFHKLGFIGKSGIYFTVAALAVLSVANLRLSVFGAFLVLYFAGYTFLQFSQRHYFYLEFIQLWAVGFVIQHGICLFFKKDFFKQILSERERLHLKARLSPCAGRVFLFASIACLLLLAPLYLLRAYQHYHVGSLFKMYETADRESLHLSYSNRGQDAAYITSPDLPKVPDVTNSSGSGNGMEYLVAEFGGEGCGLQPLKITFKYKADNPYTDFTKTTVLDTGDKGSTRIYLPVFYAQSFSFDGIELPQEYQSCMISLSRIKDPDRLPLLLGLTLSPGWEERSRYQTLTRWGRPQERKIAFYTLPGDVDIRERFFTNMIPLEPHKIVSKADIASITQGEWKIDGHGSTPYSYLVQMDYSEVNEKSYLVAEGELYKGGFTLGLLKDNQWARQINVTEKGKFKIAIEVSDPGLYAPLLANNLSEGRLHNKFRIDKIGWYMKASVGHSQLD